MKVLEDLFKEASKEKSFPLRHEKFEDIEAKNGGLFSKKDADKGMKYEDIFKLIDKAYVEAEASADMPTENHEVFNGFARCTIL